MNTATEINFGNAAVTFIVQASRRDDTLTTFRLSAAAAIAKARALMKDGWQVLITDPDGISYRASEFDRLALSAHAAD